MGDPYGVAPPLLDTMCKECWYIVEQALLLGRPFYTYIEWPGVGGLLGCKLPFSKLLVDNYLSKCSNVNLDAMSLILDIFNTRLRLLSVVVTYVVMTIPFHFQASRSCGD